ncbi:glycerate kinase [Glaciihabitans sp. dw_435]|uniref:glycerate kinase n=1 Tax=Glaciihabitans sp. dw_435 TaxID=2720081 RepID=UPI001BD2C9C6|nr:glycerate kinase [Glaciihabitans sp. dw_435]
MENTVVIAPDSFKGSLPAPRVARSIAEGWSRIRPGDRVVVLPQADGGDGTLDAIEVAVPAATWHSAGQVTGPDGEPTPGRWLEMPGGIAVVELAQSSGLPLMHRLDPGNASTRGLGEVIRAALATTPRRLVIALGGSASTDGGAGALSALGVTFADASGAALPDGGAALVRLHTVTTAELAPAPPDGVLLLTDVTAPLLGPHGAATVFGPQKGATPAQVAMLEDALARYAAILGGDPEAPGAGAAGGTGFGFATLWGAQTTPGAARISELTGLPGAMDGADVVLTGEGRFDEQSRGGKVVGSVLALAATSGVRSGIIAGSLAADPGVWSASLTTLAGSRAAAMGDTERWLRDAGAAAARQLGG